MLTLLIHASYGAAALLAFLASVLVVIIVMSWILRLRDRRPRVSGTRAAQQDVTNTRIMFQTMRDILEQQKDVARQLNVGLDNKVRYIKSVVDTAAADLQQMREAARILAEELHHTKVTLAALKAQMPPAHHAPGLPDDDEAKTEQDPSPPEDSAGLSSAATALDAVGRPVLEEPPDISLDHWAGLDFGEPSEEDDQGEEVTVLPEAPEHAEAARNAFRALLNLETSSTNRDASPDESKDESGNGRSSSTPLKKRVYEYSDVGMSVSEIARELGLGKGEVRLILNLRKDRGE